MKIRRYGLISEKNHKINLDCCREINKSA